MLEPLGLLADGLTEFGKLVLGLSVGSAFLVSFVIAVAPMPRTLRRIALLIGPLADFGVFAFFIHEDRSCGSGDCLDQAVFGFFAIFAFGAWLAGAAVGYLLRKLVATSEGSTREECRPSDD
jgi:hypothetical protein